MRGKRYDRYSNRARIGFKRMDRIGWTAADIQAGRNQQPRARRADGAVALP